MSGRLTMQGMLPWTGSRLPSRDAAVALLFRALDAVRTRQILGELDTRLLKDIGVSRSDARREAARAPWDLKPRPVGWR